MLHACRDLSKYMYYMHLDVTNDTKATFLTHIVHVADIQCHSRSNSTSHQTAHIPSLVVFNCNYYAAA